MINRREFLAIGTTAMTAAGVLGPAFANAASFEHRTVRAALPFRVIFDERFADSRLFGRQAARMGAALLGIRGDVASAWYDELRPRCQEGAVALAGLTTRSTLFCLEQLASNHWMRLRFRAEHRAMDAGLLEHRLRGPQHVLQRATGLLSTGADWRVQVADLVTHCPADATANAQCTLVTNTELAARDEESLVSWIITTK